MNLILNGYQVECGEDVIISAGIGTRSGYFGLNHVNLNTHIHNTYRFDIVTFCPHAHCTHSETQMHLDGRWRHPTLPLFQLCAVKKQPEGAVVVTAAIDCHPVPDTVFHLLTSQCSVDPEQDDGQLSAHRSFFAQHPDGLITELVDLPVNLTPGIYILMTCIIPIIDSDSHPTHLRLFTIKSIKKL